MALISAGDLSVIFGADTLFSGITFQIERGERWGVIGRNGTGKTTLMQLLTGDRDPDRGAVARTPGMRIAVMDQYRDLGGAATVWDAAAKGFAELIELEHSLSAQTQAMGVAGDAVTEAMLDKYSHDLERYEHAGGYAASARVDAVLAGLGFDPVDARTRDVATLSGGERGRLALAGQLAAPADLLILDEPTNHLDLDTTRWLEGYLRGLDESVLVISHDRAFLDAVADHILHFEQNTAFAYEGNYKRFVELRTERRMVQERAAKKAETKYKAEQDYISRNIAGHNSFQARGRQRRLARMPRLSAPPGEEGAMSVAFTAGERGGDQVVVAEKVEVTVAERTLLKPWSAVLRREDVVGLIGPNGAGKSMLLKTIVGDRKAAHGAVRIMPSIRVAYYRQDLSNVDPSATLYDLIYMRRPMWNRGQVQGHLGRFNFSGDEVLRRAGTLSGGERARIALALMMLEDANLLVFDEPTNHLDVESIEALEDALEDYDGTVILVTHDRALLSTLATRIWSLSNETITDYPGTFEEWQQDHAGRTAAQAAAAKQSASIADKGSRAKEAERSESSLKRTAERARDEAERDVARCEAALAELEQQLADPNLYAAPEGASRAAAITTARDAAKAELDRAWAIWARADAALS